MVNTGVLPIPTAKGGAENHVWYLSRGLADLGVEVDLVADTTQDMDLPHISVYPANTPNLKLFGRGFSGYLLRHAIGGVYAFRAARKLLNNRSYDVVHVHGRVAPFLISFVKRDTPMVFTVNDDPPSRDQQNYRLYYISYKLFQNTAAKRAQHVIAVHEELRKYLLSLPIDAERVSTIPNGVDVNVFSGEGRKDEQTILFVGSLTNRKGVKYLLEALAKTDQMKCKIVGSGVEMDSLVNMTKNFNIADRVTFVGDVSPYELPLYYNSASAFVLPSLREALPLSILEAMSCGLPVITTNVSGMPQVIQDGYNGFLVEPANSEELYQRIELLASNPELREEMGEKARKLVSEEYRWDIISKKTLDVYERVQKMKI